MFYFVLCISTPIKKNRSDCHSAAAVGCWFIFVMRDESIQNFHGSSNFVRYVSLQTITTIGGVMSAHSAVTTIRFNQDFS
jgi:hypothetical protein